MEQTYFGRELNLTKGAVMTDKQQIKHLTERVEKYRKLMHSAIETSRIKEIDAENKMAEATALSEKTALEKNAVSALKSALELDIRIKEEKINALKDEIASNEDVLKDIKKQNKVLDGKINELDEKIARNQNLLNGTLAEKSAAITVQKETAKQLAVITKKRLGLEALEKRLEAQKKKNEEDASNNRIDAESNRQEAARLKTGRGRK